jgi:hypothetical protein
MRTIVVIAVLLLASGVSGAGFTQKELDALPKPDQVFDIPEAPKPQQRGRLPQAGAMSTVALSRVQARAADRASQRRQHMANRVYGGADRDVLWAQSLTWRSMWRLP